MTRRFLAAVALAAVGMLATAGLGEGPWLAHAHATPPDPPAPGGGEPAGADRPAVGSEEVFVGDYETGDFGQWDVCQSVILNAACTAVGGEHHSMEIIEGSDARQGEYAARFEVRDGDVPDFGGDERSEVKADDAANTREGDERWYQWSMQFPEDFSDPEGDWFIVMQWHAGEGSPPLSINVSNAGTVDVLWSGDDGNVSETIGPVRRGEWVDYTLHAVFSNDDETGYVEVWEDGVQTLPRTFRATMHSDENYLKQGIYRESQSATHVVWLDGLRITAPEGEGTGGVERRLPDLDLPDLDLVDAVEPPTSDPAPSPDDLTERGRPHATPPSAVEQPDDRSDDECAPAPA